MGKISSDRMNEIVGSSAELGTELSAWFASPAGQYLLAWEQERFDVAVADCFGYHALQLGMAQLDGLRTNRISHRWLAVSTPKDIAVHPANYARNEDSPSDSISADALNMDASETLLQPSDEHKRRIDLVCSFNELPFESASLDLVLMPHALEFAPDPHATLREVERVLVPEGRLVVSGFNNWSLWGARQAMGRATGNIFLPRAGEFIGYRRMKDWLKLLSLEFDSGHFGCYRPPVKTAAMLNRFAFMEKVGDRWWPVFGAAYCMVAVKRVHGMRMVAPLRKAHGFVHSGSIRPAINTRAVSANDNTAVVKIKEQA
jgi:SAM-dependent methyltransferase